jgi:hypothetical protein
MAYGRFTIGLIMGELSTAQTTNGVQVVLLGQTGMIVCCAVAVITLALAVASDSIPCSDIPTSNLTLALAAFGMKLVRGSILYCCSSCGCNLCCVAICAPGVCVVDGSYPWMNHFPKFHRSAYSHSPRAPA